MEELRPEVQTIQDEALRRMTPAEKVRVASRLWEAARQLKRSGLAMQNPQWDRERLEREVTRCFSRART